MRLLARGNGDTVTTPATSSVSRRAVLGGLGLAAAATAAAPLLAAPASAAAPVRSARTATTTKTTVATTAAAGTAKSFGVFLPSYPGSIQTVKDAAAAAGRTPDVVMWYAAWSDLGAFPAAQCKEVADLGATPEITWEPWNPANGTNQPAYAMNKIAGGAHDAYIKSWAKAIAAYGKPVRIRFAHEMNGTWYPWAVGVNGTTAANHKQAWSRVRSLFNAAGATNAILVWCPNIPFPGTPSLASIYPGDSAVDMVALDGYNWGTSQSWSTWGSFSDVFGAGVSEMKALTSKPLVLGEVGCAEAGGDKAAWIADMFEVLDANPSVRGFTWFNCAKETDWRVESTQASLDSFQAGLARRYAK